MEYSNETNELIVRVLSGDATSEEKATFRAWVDSNPENQQYYKDVSAIWEQSEKSTTQNEFSAAKDWPFALTRINDIQQREKRKGKSSEVLKLLRIAATILVFIGIGYTAFKFYTHSSEVEQVATTDIKKVELPDGSQVVLNAHSRLSYPEEFQATERVISLEGEAFFEIKKNPEKPFIVRTGNVTTEVLGTSFSVNTAFDSVVVTVATGQVTLYEERKNAIKLNPGERGVAHSGNVRKSINSDRNFLSWKTNILEFRNATFASLSRDISRHFKVPIVIQSKKLAACTITARFENQNLDQTLDDLRLLFPISISTIGDTVLINGEGCGAFH
jgi:transmembrane sensor